MKYRKLSDFEIKLNVRTKISGQYLVNTFRKLTETKKANSNIN
jgi:hypothetical protein